MIALLEIKQPTDQLPARVNPEHLTVYTCCLLPKTVLTLDFKSQRARPPRRVGVGVGVDGGQGRRQYRDATHRRGCLILLDLAFLAARPESAVFVLLLDGLGDGSLGLTARVRAGGVAGALSSC